MKSLFLRYPNRARRVLEILIPLSSWFLITMPLWLSFWHPAIVAYFIITFDVYWFYKSFTLAYYAVRSFITMTAHTKTDWLPLAKKLPGFQSLYHVIIIPEYKEPLHILERTISNIAKQQYDLSRLIIVLATEAKDPQADATARHMTENFRGVFGDFIVTKHALAPGEITGKSSNMASAGKHVVEYLQKRKIPLENVTVTSCDADALLHPKYTASLSYTFLNDPDREFHFYEGAILFYSNIWRIPLPSRVYNTLNSIGNLALLSQPHRFVIFSTYSLSLKTAHEAGYWGVDVIPEDYHLFFKVYFNKGEKVKTIGLFLPVLVDAAESTGFFKTMKNQYEQSKRWAWGVSDIPFVIRGVFLHPEIPLRDRITRLSRLLEHHILWPSNWFILTIGSTLPPLINPAFGRTILGHNLAQLSSGILTLSTIFIVVVIIIDLRTKPPRPKDFAAWKLPFLYLQWITVPIVSFFLSAIPGLDAHTRLMFGKKLEYRVTEKV